MEFPSKTRPRNLGPLGVARAPIPMEERSLAVADMEAVRTVGSSIDWRATVVSR